MVPSAARGVRKSKTVPGTRISPILVSRNAKDELVNAPETASVVKLDSVSWNTFWSKVPSSQLPPRPLSVPEVRRVVRTPGLIRSPDVSSVSKSDSLIVATWDRAVTLAPVGAPNVSVTKIPLPNSAVAMPYLVPYLAHVDVIDIELSCGCAQRHIETDERHQIRTCIWEIRHLCDSQNAVDIESYLGSIEFDSIFYPISRDVVDGVRCGLRVVVRCGAKGRCRRCSGHDTEYGVVIGPCRCARGIVVALDESDIIPNLRSDIREDSRFEDGQRGSVDGPD